MPNQAVPNPGMGGSVGLGALTQEEIIKMKEIVPWYGEESPSGWVEICESNAIIRGDIDAADGFFIGTVDANRLDVLTKLNIREGAVSSYITTTPVSSKEVRITVPAHFGEHASFVDFVLPVWVGLGSPQGYYNAYFNTGGVQYASGYGGEQWEILNYYQNKVNGFTTTVYRNNTLILQSRCGLEDSMNYYSYRPNSNSTYLKFYLVQFPANYNFSLRFFDPQPITEDTTYRFILPPNVYYEGYHTYLETPIFQNTSFISYATAGIRVR